MKKLMYRQGLSARLVVAWVAIIGLAWLGAADQARAESTLVTASHSLATIPVLSANFPAPMVFSDSINGTTLFTVVGGPSQGTLAYRDVTNGIVTVAPGEPFCPSQYNWYYTSTNPLPGSDSFTWRCSDGPITSALATVSIILATNSPPVALLVGTNSVPVNSSSIRYTFKSSDPDPYQVRMYRIVRLPTNGTLEGLTPAGDRVVIPVGEWGASSKYYYLAGATPGLDSFDWQCTDGIATSETRTVTLETVANSAPYAEDTGYSVPTGSSRNFLSLEDTLYTDAAFYLDHPSRDRGQPLSLQIIEAPTNGVLEYFNGTNYVVAVAGAWGAPNARWYYTPAGTSTAGDRFVWQASDGQAPSDPATMTITTYNYEPNGNDQSLRVVSPAGRTSVALNFIHFDENQPMTFLLTAAPAGGVVEYYDAALACYQAVPVGVPVATNTWYYTPTNGYLGADTIPWRVSDGVSTSATATVNILVVSNSVPVARYMQVTCRPEDAWAGTADYTHTDEGQRCTVTIVSNASHGVAYVVGTTLVYAAQAGFKGCDTFTYKVNDGLADSNIAQVRVLVCAANQRGGALVELIVNTNLYVGAISNEVNRLKADLEDEGYTAKIKLWPSSGTSASNLWQYLRTEYDDADQFLQGAILIGDLPKVQTYANDPFSGYCWTYTDLIYWNMERFQTNDEITTRNIWVSRINADDTSWGSQDALIRRALDANHNYRKGLSRLPFTAYVFDCFTTNPASATMLDVWPAVRFGGGDVGPSPALKFLPERTDLPYAACDAFVAGGEVFNETSHGAPDYYMSNFDRNALYRVVAQQRVALIGSCSSGYFGGIANNHIFTRGGGCIFAVGGTTINWSGDFIINDEYDENVALFRQRLAAGDSWGGGALYVYPWEGTRTGNRIVFYGDMSLKPMASVYSNAMPNVVSFTNNCTTVYVGQPVTFTIAVSDPDGAGAKSTNVLYRHQVEWFMNGYNYGKNVPTYTTNDYQNTGWTNVTHTFSAAGTYTVRAEVMDEWQARGWKEMTVTVQQPLVTCSVTVPTNGAVVMEGTNLTITAFALVTYGSVSNVEFTLDGLKIATALSSPYSCVWTNAVKGSHVLTAKATDGAGNFTNSTAVSLSVLPITTCTITAPAHGTVLKAGTNLSITATAAVLAGTVSKVEFFHDGMKIGEGLSAPYACVWSNVPIGLYALTARAIQSDGRAGDSAAVLGLATASGSWEGVYASGGTVTNYTQNGTNWTAHIFTNTSGETFTPLKGSLNVEYLVVAGGGSGGRVNNSGNHAGGGGAGGLLANSPSSLLTISSAQTITVGAGGAGRTTDGATGTKGGNSSIGTLVVTTGGGGGTSYGGTTTDKNGGSGGGASAWGGAGTGIAGPPRQGYNGGTDDGADGNGAGGGGAGGIGGNSTAGVGGNGGPGVTDSITGTATAYAGGGGGPGTTTQGAGGSGIGGNGMQTGSGTTINGRDGTGSGGGGVGTGTSGKGGDGIVIVRYMTGGYEAWRQTHFDSTSLTNSAVSGATADPDHDGLNNEQEFRAGTNPTNASSCLAIIAPTNNPVVAGGGFVVTWQSVTGKTYSVLAATNLMNGFTALTNGLPATPTVNVYTDKVNGAGQKFYRVGVE